MQADISGSRVPMSTTYFSIFRGGERCPLGLPFLMHSLQLTKLPSRVVSRCASFSVSRSDMLSFPGENWRRRVGSVELEELRKGFQVIVLRSLR